MSNTIAASDLNRLARLSSAVVHGIDFPELGDARGATSELLGEVDRLNDVYRNDALLFDLRAAVCSRPMQKQELYSTTLQIVKQARGHTSSALPTTSSFPVHAPHTMSMPDFEMPSVYS